MVTVILTVRLDLPGVDSLKEKRRILKSLLTKLRSNFNISIAEVAENDRLRSAVLGVAVVSNDNSFGHQVAAKVIDKIEGTHEVVLVDYSTESY